MLTLNRIAFPLHLVFCSKQGRANTDKPSLLLSMLKRLKEEFAKHGIDVTLIPLTMDSWFASEPLKQALIHLGFKKILVAGKGNYTFSIDNKKQKASLLKKEVVLKKDQWGIEVPACRVKAYSPTFGHLALLFYYKNTTRTYYLMDLSPVSMRGAEMWHIWKQHHLIECFWKSLKSVFHVGAMQLQGHGLYTGLLIKVLSYLLAMRLKGHKTFSQLSITQILRTIRSNHDLETLMVEHFHLPILLTQ